VITDIQLETILIN